MGTVSQLFHVNGGSKDHADETDAVQCNQCGAWLSRRYACSAPTPSGRKFFCKFEGEPEDAQYSCYNQ